MKNLNSFEAFRLGKSQMSKVSGGYVVCQAYYSDEFGGSFAIRYNEASKEEAREALQAQHPDAKVSCWEQD